MSSCIPFSKLVSGTTSYFLSGTGRPSIGAYKINDLADGVSVSARRPVSQLMVPRTRLIEKERKDYL